MVKDITAETAAAGALGYSTAFISTAVSQTMKASSSQLIRNIGNSCLPVAAISFAVESYDSVSEFAQGQISGGELAYDLAENATAIAGGIKGAAVGAGVGTKAGAAIGMIAGPAGPAIGATVGGVTGSIIGGVIGCVVASEMYATAVELGAENAGKIAEKAHEFANNTVELAEDVIPDKVSDIKSAFNDFAEENNLPFKV